MIPVFSSSFACTFVNDLPVANWSGGSSQVKLYGVGTVINSNRLHGSASVYANLNTDINLGTLVVKIKFPYAGAPAANQTIAMLSGASVGDWVVNIIHRTDSYIEVVFGASGSYPVGILTSAIVCSPAIGDEWEFTFTQDYSVAKKFRMFMGDVTSGVATLQIDADTSSFMPTLVPNPVVDLVSFGRDALTPTDFAGYEFWDILMYTSVLYPAAASYVIQQNYISSINPPLSLPSSTIYGRVLYNNLPVPDAVITFKPTATYIYNGVVSTYSYTATSDVNGYFEQAVPYSPASIKCKYRCSFIIGTVSYAKSGELTMPTDTFLVIQ